MVSCLRVLPVIQEARDAEITESRETSEREMQSFTLGASGALRGTRRASSTPLGAFYVRSQEAPRKGWVLIPLSGQSSIRSPANHSDPRQKRRSDHPFSSNPSLRQLTMHKESSVKACMKLSETAEWVTPVYFENYTVLLEKEDNGKKTSRSSRALVCRQNNQFPELNPSLLISTEVLFPAPTKCSALPRRRLSPRLSTSQSPQKPSAKDLLLRCKKHFIYTSHKTLHVFMY